MHHHRHRNPMEDADVPSSRRPEPLPVLSGTGSPDEPRTGATGTRLRLLGGLLALLRLGPVLILGLLVVVMSNLSPVFATSQNLGNVVSQTAVIAILAIGQLMVILTRGIDLSVGSALALSAVVGASVFGSTGGGALTVLAMLGTGAAVGAVNGLVLVYGRLPHPFIITLATLSIARGLALGISGGQPIRGMPDVVGTIGGDTATWLAPWLPNSTFLLIGVAVVITVFLTRVVWGRWIYVVGGNPDGARRLGVPRNWVLISVYVCSGL